MPANIANILINSLQKGRTRAFYVKVIPKSARTEVVGQMDDGTFKIRVAAVPEKNKANAELIKFLAKTFNVDKSRVKILAGETSHKKLIEIT